MHNTSQNTQIRYSLLYFERKIYKVVYNATLSTHKYCYYVVLQKRCAYSARICLLVCHGRTGRPLSATDSPWPPHLWWARSLYHFLWQRRRTQPPPPRLRRQLPPPHCLWWDAPSASLSTANAAAASVRDRNGLHFLACDGCGLRHQSPLSAPAATATSSASAIAVPVLGLCVGQ